MTSCYWCNKLLGSHEHVDMEDSDMISFCGKKHLNEYVGAMMDWGDKKLFIK